MANSKCNIKGIGIFHFLIFFGGGGGGGWGEGGSGAQNLGAVGYSGPVSLYPCYRNAL